MDWVTDLGFPGSGRIQYSGCAGGGDLFGNAATITRQAMRQQRASQNNKNESEIFDNSLEIN
jgi:hypothetical protein